jgi:hypothetical protein
MLTDIQPRQLNRPRFVAPAETAAFEYSFMCDSKICKLFQGNHSEDAMQHQICKPQSIALKSRVSFQAIDWDKLCQARTIKLHRKESADQHPGAW